MYIFNLRWIIRIYLLCCLHNEINRFIKRNYRGLVVTTSKKKKKKRKKEIYRVIIILVYAAIWKSLVHSNGKFRVWQKIT